MDKTQHATQALTSFLQAHPRLVVLTGAGISASSGIPTYRDRDGVWQHREPINHQEFIRDESTRQRYWARSLFGWPVIRDAHPGAGHRALASLERDGHISLLITQNVDRLHQQAGSNNVIDLHGRLDKVRCLACQETFSRDVIQTQLARDNQQLEKPVVEPRPDGDADLPDDFILQLHPPACKACGGVLQPDVVFFGDTVPKGRVQACMEAIESADALLAIGSSLQVYSGFRFCKRAAVLGKPLAIINPGTTRADPMAQLKLLHDCEPLLHNVASL